MAIFVSSLHPNQTESHTKISIWPVSGMETSEYMWRLPYFVIYS